MPESLKILIVDDEPGVLRLCQKLLDRAGHQAIAISNPNQALSLLAQQKIDLMLVDIRMPVMDGFQLMAEARHFQPELSVVVMTGYGTVETAVEALHQGADSLILKPFGSAELLQGIQRAIQESHRKLDVFRLMTLRPLFGLTKDLFTETNPVKLKKIILNAVCDYLNCNVALLYRRQTANSPLELVDWRGDIVLERLKPIEVELIQPAEFQNDLILVNRDGSEEASHPVLDEMFSELNLKSVMCIPMMYKGAGFGNQGNRVLIAARSSNQPAFQEPDAELFAILARQACAALENAFLYSELRSSLAQLEKSQQALVQAEKLATAGRLTASIAHEINNPLQAVQNCLYLTAYNELSNEERGKYLDLAQSELERLMNVVQRMLDLYRPGARDRQWVDIDQVINRVLLLLEQQLNQNGVCVHTNFYSPSIRVMVVMNQIQQVLLNLVLNAIEALPNGGNLFIETSIQNDQVEVIIEDDGSGIPSSICGQLFEPFVSSKENGVGLGLAVSYGIINAHGGTLGLIAGRGKGACFQILLPIGEQQ